MIVADEDVDPDEIVAAEQAYAELTGHALPDGELAREASDVRSQGRSLQEVLGCLPCDLEPDAQAQVLTAAFQVASADGFVLEEEDELLRAVANAIGMTDEQTRTVLGGLIS